MVSSPGGSESQSPNDSQELLLPGPPHPLSTNSLLPSAPATVHKPSPFSHDAKRSAPHDVKHKCEIQENNNSTQVKYLINICVNALYCCKCHLLLVLTETFLSAHTNENHLSLIMYTDSFFNWCDLVPINRICRSSLIDFFKPGRLD